LLVIESEMFIFVIFYHFDSIIFNRKDKES